MVRARGVKYRTPIVPFVLGFAFCRCKRFLKQFCTSEFLFEMNGSKIKPEYELRFLLRDFIKIESINKIIC